MDEWLDYKGKEFFQGIGVKKGHIVLDFGCRHGNYAIPASLVVGKKGKIFAVDKNKEALNELISKAKERGLSNIETFESIEKIKLLLSDESVDIVLLYDVLHLVEDRKHLLTNFYHILKPTGILSVYPKHHQTHMNMNLTDLMKEIESVDFNFDVKLLKSLMHDDKIEKGYVINFRKN
jgi:ubiquinone/menaquinone biosynthesis C-methylase UbiE